VLLIGLTGGIASGKSTVAKLLAAHGAETIDADQVAREVVEVGSTGLSSVIQEFGEGVLLATGELNREKLGHAVFTEPKLRLKLEAILHPLIKARTMQLIMESKKPVVVYAVPLLVEAKVDYPFEMIITVEAGVENQIERLVKSRGLTVEQARERIAAQASRQEREARADFVLDSSGTHEQLAKQVDTLWGQIETAMAGKQN
jgi:dephospho-CoA kinase